MTDYLADEAVKAIKANSNRPFFLYLPPNAIHTPLQAKKADYDALPQIKNHRLRVYGAMTARPGRATSARMLQSAEGRGAGPEHPRSSSPATTAGRDYIGLPDVNQPLPRLQVDLLRGRRPRTPFFMRWPGGDRRGARRMAVPRRATWTSSPPRRAAGAARCRRPHRSTASTCPPSSQARPRARPHQALYWRSGPVQGRAPAATGSSRSARRRTRSGSTTWPDPTEQRDLRRRPARQGHRAARPDPRANDAQSAKPIWPSPAAGACLRSISHGVRKPKSRIHHVGQLDDGAAAAVHQCGLSGRPLGGLVPGPGGRADPSGPALIHSFLPDGGAEVIAGLDLGDRRDLVIGVFAWEARPGSPWPCCDGRLRYRTARPRVLTLLILERG